MGHSCLGDIIIIHRKSSTKNTGATEQSEDPLRAKTSPLLLDVAGLDDQPAGSWKRLACWHYVDDKDEDVTQTGR